MISPMDSPLTKIEDINLSTRTKNALIKAGFSQLSDFENVTKQNIKNIIGIGPTGYREITKLINLKSDKGRFELRRFLVEKFIKISLLKNYDQETKNSVWQNNITIASRLLKKYNEEEFWKSFNLSFKLNSLAFFLTEKGNEILSKGYSEWKLNLTWKEDEKENYKLECEKQGEDAILDNKPKTLKDFLNGKSNSF